MTRESAADPMTFNPDIVPETAAVGRERGLYERAARLAGIGAWECDLATERLTWTEGVYNLFELPAGTPLHRRAIVDLYAEASRETMERARAEAIATGHRFAIEAEIRTARGTARWMRLVGDTVREDGRPVRLFGIKQDITAEREAWERLRRLADCDALTGLANRGVFDARYRAMVDDELNRAGVSGLALVDIDRFKSINDGLGHAAGDECLRQVAVRLKRALGGVALVARIGGDEFAALFEGWLSPAAFEGALRRTAAALSRPILWEGRRIDLGASIGATRLGRPHRRPISRVFAEADEALYAAKAAGRNTLRLYGEAELASDRRRSGRGQPGVPGTMHRRDPAGGTHRST